MAAEHDAGLPKHFDREGALRGAEAAYSLGVVLSVQYAEILKNTFGEESAAKFRGMVGSDVARTVVMHYRIVEGGKGDREEVESEILRLGLRQLASAFIAARAVAKKKRNAEESRLTHYLRKLYWKPRSYPEIGISDAEAQAMHDRFHDVIGNADALLANGYRESKKRLLKLGVQLFRKTSGSLLVGRLLTWSVRVMLFLVFWGIENNGDGLPVTRVLALAIGLALADWVIDRVVIENILDLWRRRDLPRRLAYSLVNSVDAAAQIVNATYEPSC